MDVIFSDRGRHCNRSGGAGVMYKAEETWYDNAFALGNFGDSHEAEMHAVRAALKTANDVQGRYLGSATHALTNGLLRSDRPQDADCNHRCYRPAFSRLNRPLASPPLTSLRVLMRAETFHRTPKATRSTRQSS